jgi:hypothetical protein
MLARMAFAGAWLAVGCGGSLAPVQPVPQVQPESFALCQAAAGSTLQELGVQQGSPFNLVTANGNLYYALGDGNSSTEAIMGLPLSGGPPVTLAMAEGYQLWLDDQAVNTAAVDDRLWRVPLGGGDATLIADGNTTGPPNYNVATAQTFDGTNFFWDLRPQNGMPFWSVWQISVAGGGAQKLADLPIPTGPNVNWTMLRTSAHGVLIAYENFPQVGAYLVPPGGGTPQVLPSPPLAGDHADNALLGTSPTAVLWDTADVDPVTGGNRITLRLTDVAGPGGPTVREFWPDHPANFTPYGVYSWSGGDDGSWLISGFEPFDDGATHASLWLVDADGHGSRLGCDPNVGYGAGIVTAALATPTAIYAVVGSSAGGLFDYRIVQLSR